MRPGETVGVKPNIALHARVRCGALRRHLPNDLRFIDKNVKARFLICYQVIKLDYYFGTAITFPCVVLYTRRNDGRRPIYRRAPQAR